MKQEIKDEERSRVVFSKKNVVNMHFTPKDDYVVCTLMLSLASNKVVRDVYKITPQDRARLLGQLESSSAFCTMYFVEMIED